MTTRSLLSRRTFLTSGLGAGAWAVAGAPYAQTHRPKPLRLLFYTDIHARVEWQTPEAMAKAVDAINAQQAGLVIVGGDLITDGFQAGAESLEPRWDAYLDMHRAIKPPAHPVIGNHDLVGAIPEDGTEPEPDPRRVFREKMHIDNTYRSFDQAGYHFILLDSIEVGGAEYKYRGFIEEEQLEWIKRDLEKVPSDKPIVLVTHIPLLTAFHQAAHGHDTPPPVHRVVHNNREVLKLFRGKNLKAVLQGHLHVNELIHWRGTRFITGGAVSARWWRGPWYGTEEGFGVLTLDGDRVDWEYIDYGWEARRPAGV